MYCQYRRKVADNMVSSPLDSGFSMTINEEFATKGQRVAPRSIREQKAEPVDTHLSAEEKWHDYRPVLLLRD